jgi:FkbM family methyltransferase
MKVSTLFKMNYGWAYRYVKKRVLQRLRFFTAPNHYEVTISGVTVRLLFSTPYHHSIAQSQATGYWDENELLEQWMKYSIQSPVIFDVGGFNGIYGLFAKKANPSADVYIFEPDQINIQHIQKNARANDLVIHVISKAATDHDGRIKFSGDGSTGSRVADWGKPVDAVMLKSYGSPDLLKLDIEGHESEALKGADLTNTKTIFVEINKSETRQLLENYKEVKHKGLNSILVRP